MLVPTHLFKVVYRPRTNQAAAYFLKNEATTEYTVISVAQLEKTVGIDLLPGVPQHIKEVAADLPAPTPHNEGKSEGLSGRRRRSETAGPGEYRLNPKILNTVEQLLRLLNR